MHNEMPKKLLVFVVQDGGPAVLGIPDIDKLSLISFNCKTTDRQVEKDDIIHNSMCESPIQTKVGNVSSLKVKSRIQNHEVNKMQTIHLSHLLSLIQWSWVRVTMI